MKGKTPVGIGLKPVIFPNCILSSFAYVCWRTWYDRLYLFLEAVQSLLYDRVLSRKAHIISCLLPQTTTRLSKSYLHGHKRVVGYLSYERGNEKILAHTTLIYAIMVLYCRFVLVWRRHALVSFFGNLGWGRSALILASQYS